MEKDSLMNIVHKTLTASLLALSVSSAFAAGSLVSNSTPRRFSKPWNKAAASLWNNSARKTPGQC